MNKKLRLLLFKECNRKCPGCCNNDWDLDNLSICTDYSPYDIIMLTGGEPMLRPQLIIDTVAKIRAQNKNAAIYVYTAYLSYLIIDILNYVDGITFTLHEQGDVLKFYHLNETLYENMDKLKNKSLRLNIFKNVNIGGVDLSLWKVKDNIEWIKNCPLPENETFMRLDPNTKSIV